MSIIANSNEGHRQRLREKILKSGLDCFHPSTSSTGIGDNNVIGLKITQDVARRYLADRIVDLDYIAKVYLIRINCILFFRESRQ